MKIKLTVVFLCLAFVLQAQSIKFGVKAGLNFNADEGFLQTVGSITETANANNQTGWQLGAFSRIGLAGVFIQPELLYTQFSSEYQVTGADFKQVKSRIDLPIHLGKKILKVGRIQAGPVFSYYLEDDIDLNNFTNLKQDDFSVGMQIGAGVDLSKFSIDARYEFGFGDRSTEFIQNNTAFRVDERPNLLRLSLGYTF